MLASGQHLCSRRALAGPHDSVLLERVVSDARHHWEIWSAEGHLVGSFVLRPEDELQDASDSTIWAVTRSRIGPETLLVATVRARARSIIHGPGRH